MYKYSQQLGFMGLVYHVSGIVLNTLQTSPLSYSQKPCIFVSTEENGETEAQKGGVTYPKSHSKYTDGRYIGRGFYCWSTNLGSYLNVFAAYRDLLLPWSYFISTVVLWGSWRSEWVPCYDEKTETWGWKVISPRLQSKSVTAPTINTKTKKTINLSFRLFALLNRYQI